MSFLVLVVDDEPDVEMLFRQQFRRDLRDKSCFKMRCCKGGPHIVTGLRSEFIVLRA
jgi:hypothetical protein